MSKDAFMTVEALCADYGSRARELRGQGKKVIGYLSALGPVEILTAAGTLPIRLKGYPSEPITKGDAHMETIVCPFVRNVFDAAMKGRYNFLDGMVMPHLCDSIDRTSDVWSTNLNLSYWHFLNVPHLTDDSSVEFMKRMLQVFVASLVRFTGRPITEDEISRSILSYNANRKAIRDLYALRKHSPPLISGTEMTKVLLAAMSMPVEESTDLVKRVTAQVAAREPKNDALPRIIIVGGHIDNVALVETIEGSGAHVVMDDTTIGSKVYWGDVEETADPIEALARRYLRETKLPTTYRHEGESYEENLAVRFGHLTRFVNDLSIDAAILFVYKRCDPYGFDVPAVKSFLESLGVPVLYLEDEYSNATLPRTKTRVEAFVEMLA
jgi:bcr-type benzoyl-CoA reductase subunit C